MLKHGKYPLLLLVSFVRETNDLLSTACKFHSVLPQPLDQVTMASFLLSQLTKDKNPPKKPFQFKTFCFLGGKQAALAPFFPADSSDALPFSGNTSESESVLDGLISVGVIHGPQSLTTKLVH